jgi:signal transduction histidine kinase
VGASHFDVIPLRRRIRRSHCVTHALGVHGERSTSNLRSRKSRSPIVSSRALARPLLSARVPTTAAFLSEVEDECGGLLCGTLSQLFQPFEQQSADTTGLGRGLAFSRWGTQANDGRIHARNLPGRGCVFTVDLPRIHVPVSVVS